VQRGWPTFVSLDIVGGDGLADDISGRLVDSPNSAMDSGDITRTGLFGYHGVFVAEWS
jgi:hypothetical protein